MATAKGFSITEVDLTTFVEESSPKRYPKSCVMIMGSFERGITNYPVQFYGGEVDKFKKTVGIPNYAKYGPGLDIAVDLLDNNVELGVLLVNIRPEDAAAANVVHLVKTKIHKDVPKTTAKGEPLYRTPDNQEVTVATGNVAIVRDRVETVHVKQVLTGVKDRRDLLVKLDQLYVEEDAEGFQVIPLMAYKYVGNSTFGNKHNFRLTPKVSEVDGKTYYLIERNDGDGVVKSSSLLSFFPVAQQYNESVFIENVLKKIQSDLTVVSSIHYDKFLDLIDTYITEKDPAKVDIFDCDEYQFYTGTNSLDVTADRAFMLAGGTDGTAANIETAYANFLKGDIVPDITSPLVYRIDVIPDLEFSDNICALIEQFIGERYKSTKFFHIAGSDSFESAISAVAQAKDNNLVFEFAGAQCPSMYNTYAKRTFFMPTIYYTMLMWKTAVVTNAGNTFMPIAGKSCRWTGFDEDTLVVPKDSEEYLAILDKNRINYVKRDKDYGAFMAKQWSRVITSESDLSQYNNVAMFSSIVYDIIEKIHTNQYKANDPDDVKKFKETVQLDIQPKYSPYATYITVNVYKKGMTGKDKNTNIIEITVNFKDLAIDAEVLLIATDAQLS